MSKGWDAVAQAAQETAAARQRASETLLPELKVNAKNPGPYYIRFCEQGEDVNSYPVHEYKVPDGRGGVYNRRFTCLSEINQVCPGCQAGLRQKRRGVYNVIQRNRPVYRKGQDGKAMKDPAGNYITDGWQDTVVIANVGQPTSEMLRKADGDYHGLMCRDFQVTFSGDTFQAWDLKPVMDQQGNSAPTAMSENDMALMARKYDLDKYMAPPSAQEAAQIVARYGQNSGAAPGNQAPAVGGAGGAQGNAGVAGAANGFLNGAQVPGGQPVNAFGQAAGLPQPGPVAPPVQPAPVQPPAQAAQPPQPQQGAVVTPPAAPLVPQSGAPVPTPPPPPPPATPEQQGVPVQTG